MVECLNEEIRRRERVIRIFPNEASAPRLVGALLAEWHEKWISGRRYFDMEEYWNLKQTPTLVPSELGREPAIRAA